MLNFIYAFLSIIYMYLMSICIPRGFFFLWNLYPFSCLDFASAVHWKCHRNLKTKSLEQKFWGKKKVWVVDVWIKQLKLPVISQEPDFNTLSHIAESKNSPLVSTWNISFTERLWTVCLNGFFLATNSGTYPRNMCFAVI